MTLHPRTWGQPAWLLLIAGAATVLFWSTDLDLRVSARFYHPDAPGGPWPDADRPIGVALHRLTPWLAATLAAMGVLMMVAGRRRAAWRTLTTQGLLVVLGLALGPGLLVNALLKDQARRPRPRQTVTLGGDHRYVPPLVIGPHGKSFPCGDASVGFALGVFGYVLRRRQPVAARVVFAAAVLLGLAIGVARVAAGAHFISDVLWAGILVWGTLLALDRVLSRIGARGGLDATGSVVASGRSAPAPAGRRRAVLLATGGGFLGLVLLAALPFEQVIDQSWAPLPDDSGAGGAGSVADEPPWRIEVGVHAGSVRLVLEPGGRLTERGAALSLHGRLDGLSAPWARVRTSIETRPERSVIVTIRPSGWFTDLEGTTVVRVAAAAAAVVTIEVTEGVLTIVAPPGAAGLPLVITRTRPDALRLRGVPPDRVRNAGPRTGS